MKIRFIQIFVLTAIIIASYSFYFYNTGIKLNKNASGENKIANQIATTTETKEGAKNEQDTTDKTISVVKEQSKIETKEIPKTQPKEIITTQPLKGSVEENNAILTAMGVIEETNRQRQLNGLPSLVYNEKLSLAAQNKVNDMFNLQYFAHESPTGAGPADLANDVDYKYLMVGENLALGNYESDKILVDAWMNSPGHRANILNPKYTEIGVSVKSGMYEGYNTWLSVQEFGRPESDCPIPDKNLEQEILSGVDLHLINAMTLTHKKADEVTKADRKTAKFMTFGILYGQSSYGLSNMHGVAEEIAELFINEFYEKYEGVRDAHKRLDSLFKQTSSTPYDLDPKYYAKVLKVPNNKTYFFRTFERGFKASQYKNYILQGGAGDLHAYCVGSLSSFFLNNHDKCSIVNNVHDSIVFDVKKEWVEFIKDYIKSNMELYAKEYTGTNLFTVDVKCGDTWGACKDE